MRRDRLPPTLTAEAAVVAKLSEGGATMQQLARAARRTIPGIRSALHRLRKDGLVRVKLEAIATAGRPADLWFLTARGFKLAERQRREIRQLFGVAS